MSNNVQGLIVILGLLTLVGLGIHAHSIIEPKLKKNCDAKNENLRFIFQCVDERNKLVYEIKNLVYGMPDDRTTESQFLGGAAAAIKPQMLWRLYKRYKFNINDSNFGCNLDSHSELTITTHPNWSCILKEKDNE